MKKGIKEETYNRARYLLMSHLLFKYLRKGGDTYGDPKFNMGLTQPTEVGSLVVPYAIYDPREWYIGWYRGVDDEGYYLIESLETKRIGRFGNCGLLGVNDEIFTKNPRYFYSDRQFDMVEKIEKRVKRHNFWFAVGNIRFHDDGKIEVPIRQKFTDEYYVKTYKNFKSVTIKELDAQCQECSERNKEKKEK